MDRIGIVCSLIYEYLLPAMTIKEAQEAVDRWIREYGVRYFSGSTRGCGPLDQGIRRALLLRTDEYGGSDRGSRRTGSCDRS